MKDLIMAGIVCLIMVTAKAYADPRWHQPTTRVTEVTEVVNITEVVNVTELVNTINIENYTPDNCQGIAIAQAGANNTMYMGTDKPQLSLGVGECDGGLASSLMFGMRLNNSLMLNGSWATDNEVNAFGVGMTVIFK